MIKCRTQCPMNEPMNNHRLTVVILFFGIILSCQFFTLYEMFLRFLTLITCRFVLFHLSNEKCMSMQQKKQGPTLVTFPCKKNKTRFNFNDIPMQQKTRLHFSDIPMQQKNKVPL